MFSSVFKKNSSHYKTRTFTYYLPAPPVRKTGYQEKEFDSIIKQLSDMDFEVLEIHTSSHSSEEKSGIWIVCLLGAKTKEIYDQHIHIKGHDQSDVSSHHVPLDPDIIHD